MEREKSGRARLVLLLWLLVAIFYFYLASDYIQIVMRDDAFEDYLEFSVQLVGSQGRANAELRELVMAKGPGTGDPSGSGPSGYPRPTPDPRAPRWIRCGYPNPPDFERRIQQGVFARDPLFRPSWIAVGFAG